ncbi:hypothetical protein GCM10010302_05160 [Streptomyces polychromogenes]|uniref:Uncharacterized protein n=1 Tax=Streptomyces polychromogenes TaxID=67342 RepID=A0ABN0V1Q5_9ACTN
MRGVARIPAAVPPPLEDHRSPAWPDCGLCGARRAIPRGAREALASMASVRPAQKSNLSAGSVTRCGKSAAAHLP